MVPFTRDVHVNSSSTSSFVLRVTGVNPEQQQNWKRYAFSLLVSNLVMWLVTFLVVLFQHLLPLNPDGIGGMEPTLAFNTISSFVTNTNLQHYSGESGLSYLSQMVVITFLQFVTAGTGIAAAVALCRRMPCLAVDGDRPGPYLPGAFGSRRSRSACVTTKRATRRPTAAPSSSDER